MPGTPTGEFFFQLCRHWIFSENHSRQSTLLKSTAEDLLDQGKERFICVHQESPAMSNGTHVFWTSDFSLFMKGHILQTQKKTLHFFANWQEDNTMWEIENWGHTMSIIQFQKKPSQTRCCHDSNCLRLNWTFDVGDCSMEKLSLSWICFVHSWFVRFNSGPLRTFALQNIALRATIIFNRASLNSAKRATPPTIVTLFSLISSSLSFKCTSRSKHEHTKLFLKSFSLVDKKGFRKMEIQFVPCHFFENPFLSQLPL